MHSMVELPISGYRGFLAKQRQDGNDGMFHENLSNSLEFSIFSQ